MNKLNCNQKRHNHDHQPLDDSIDSTAMINTIQFEKRSDRRKPLRGIFQNRTKYNNQNNNQNNNNTSSTDLATEKSDSPVSSNRTSHNNSDTDLRDVSRRLDDTLTDDQISKFEAGYSDYIDDDDDDDDDDQFGTATLISGISAPTLDGCESVQTTDESAIRAILAEFDDHDDDDKKPISGMLGMNPLSHLATSSVAFHNKNYYESDDDGVSSMNSSIGPASIVQYRDQQRQPKKILPTDESNNDNNNVDDLEYYRTDVYSTEDVIGNDQEQLEKKRSHPSSGTEEEEEEVSSIGNNNNNVGGTNSKTKVVYYEVEDAINRSYLKNTRAGRKLMMDNNNNNGKQQPKKQQQKQQNTVQCVQLNIPSSSSTSNGGKQYIGIDGIESDDDIESHNNNRNRMMSRSGSISCSEDGDICSLDSCILSLAELQTTDDGRLIVDYTKGGGGSRYEQQRSLTPSGGGGNNEYVQKQQFYATTSLDDDDNQRVYQNKDPNKINSLRVVSIANHRHNHNHEETDDEEAITPNNTITATSSGDNESVIVSNNIFAPYHIGEQQRRLYSNESKVKLTKKSGVCSLPLWLDRAPKKLKLLLLLGFILLLGSIALVTVGISTQLNHSNDNNTDAVSSMNDNNNNNSTSSSSSSSSTDQRNQTNRERQPADDADLVDNSSTNNTEVTLSPVLPNQPMIITTNVPTSSLIMSAPTNIPLISSPTTSSPTTLSPTTLSPTIVPTSDFTMGPTERILTGSTIFYVTAGQYDDYEVNHLSNPAYYQKQLGRIPPRDGTPFLVQLGDWNKPNNTLCSEDTYRNVSDFYQSSSVPVYFVMGDNEFNNCDDPIQAKQYWINYLTNQYESQYWDQPQWTVNRQGDWDQDYSDFMENFDFVNDNNIAFSSISVPGGEVNTADGNDTSSTTTDQEWLTREDANYALIDACYQFYRNNIDVLFIFVNDALPGSNAANSLFYTVLMGRIRDSYSDMNFVMVYRMSATDDTGGHWLKYQYNGIPNLAVTSVMGPSWPPLQVTIESNGRNTMPTISIDISWYYDLWGIEKPF